LIKKEQTLNKTKGKEKAIGWIALAIEERDSQPR